MKKSILIIIIVYFFVNDLKAQDPDTTSVLTIVSGGSVYYPINSMNKFENGMEYLSWTTLRVYFRATDGGGAQSSQWRLKVRANTANIVGDNLNTLDLRTVQIRVESSGSGVINAGWLSLDDVPDVILVDQGNNSNTIDVVLSYRCGMDGTYPLTGESPDYYNVDLVYTLEPDP